MSNENNSAGAGRKKSVRIICFSLLIVIILLVLFAPLPKHMLRTYSGFATDGQQETPVTAALDYWKYDFLLFADRYSGTLEINSDGESVELEMATYVFETPETAILSFVSNNGARISSHTAFSSSGSSALDRLIMVSNGYTYALGSESVSAEEALSWYNGLIDSGALHVG